MSNPAARETQHPYSEHLRNTGHGYVADELDRLMAIVERADNATTVCDRGLPPGVEKILRDMEADRDRLAAIAKPEVFSEIAQTESTTAASAA